MAALSSDGFSPNHLHDGKPKALDKADKDCTEPRVKCCKDSGVSALSVRLAVNCILKLRDGSQQERASWSNSHVLVL